MQRLSLHPCLRAGLSYSRRFRAPTQTATAFRRHCFSTSSAAAKTTSVGAATAMPGTTTQELDEAAVYTQPPAAEAFTQPGAPGATSQMIALAQKIAKETEKLEAYLQGQGLPMPSFDVDAPPDFPMLPDDLKMSRRAIIAAADELKDLVTGPRESMRWEVWNFLEVLAIHILTQFEIPKLVPLEGTIPLATLHTKTTLDPVNLARLLRLAMTRHIFREPVPGQIAHTAASCLLASDADMQAWAGFNGEDIMPAAAHVLDALRTHPEATSPLRSGFTFAQGTVDAKTMFAVFGSQPWRAKRMGRAMASLTGGEGYEVSHFVDWSPAILEEIDARSDGVLVDLGGSHGFVCVDLARRWRNMRFVVQDLEGTIESAPSPLCEDEQVAGRIELMTHDFFTEQVVKGADVYFFRWILHNYSTPFAVKILRSLVPALKPGSRVVINDHCLREPGTEDAWDERVIRRMDLVMMCLLNAQERTEEEFRELFRLADERFVFKGVTRPKGCRMSIIEAVWEP